MQEDRPLMDPAIRTNSLNRLSASFESDIRRVVNDYRHRSLSAEFKAGILLDIEGELNASSD